MENNAESVVEMPSPCRPLWLYSLLCFVLDIEQEVDERVGVIHPAQVENDGCMEFINCLSCYIGITLGLDNGGYEDGKSNGKHSDGLVLDTCQLTTCNLSIQKIKKDGNEAKYVLCIDSNVNAYTRNVWVGLDASGVHNTASGVHGG